MAEPGPYSDKGEDLVANQTVQEFIRTLSREHRMLVILKGQLYEGSWEPMLEDLKNRLAGKPYIFKLATRIKDDIERIEQMRAFEEKHGVDLTDFVDLEE
jgi:hypothetical protein